MLIRHDFHFSSDRCQRWFIFCLKMSLEYMREAEIKVKTKGFINSDIYCLVAHQWKCFCHVYRKISDFSHFVVYITLVEFHLENSFTNSLQEGCCSLCFFLFFIFLVNSEKKGNFMLRRVSVEEKGTIRHSLTQLWMQVAFWDSLKHFSALFFVILFLSIKLEWEIAWK